MSWECFLISPESYNVKGDIIFPFLVVLCRQETGRLSFFFDVRQSIWVLAPAEPPSTWNQGVSKSFQRMQRFEKVEKKKVEPRRLSSSEHLVFALHRSLHSKRRKENGRTDRSGGASQRRKGAKKESLKEKKWLNSTGLSSPPFFPVQLVKNKLFLLFFTLLIYKKEKQQRTVIRQASSSCCSPCSWASVI